MNTTPNFSKKFLEKINSVHASASTIFKSINPEALALVSPASGQMGNSAGSGARKLKR